MELIIVWYLSLLLIDVSCLLIIHYVTVLTGANGLGMVYPCKGSHEQLIDPMCKHINLVPRLQKAGAEPGNEAISITTHASMKSKRWATSKCMHTAN